MGFVHTYTSLNNVDVYENAYHVFMDYEQMIRQFDELQNSTKPLIFWAAGHHINPIFYVYKSRESKLDGDEPIGILTGFYVGRLNNHPINEKKTDIDIIFKYDSSLGTSIEQQADIHIKNLDNYLSADLD